MNANQALCERRATQCPRCQRPLVSLLFVRAQRHYFVCEHCSVAYTPDALPFLSR
jgi:hypothetical protein